MTQLVFRHGGRTYPMGDMRVAELEEVERVLGVNYVDIRPLASMRHKVAIMTVLLRRDHDEEAAAAIIGALTNAEAEAAWSVEPDDLPEAYEAGIPLAGGGPSTPTSSRSPASRGAGRRK